MTELKLIEVRHPTKTGLADFDALVGIDGHKAALVDELTLVLDRDRFAAWAKTHHPCGLGILNRLKAKAPLVLLSGEVGCGKTALASCVATPVARALDKEVLCLETPSDIRGGGHVGELSARITDAFAQARAKAGTAGCAILIIDEADDLATSRSQSQAHHEDRAGVNVLIKQIDQLTRDKAPLAVIMITNREDVLDPAVLRRSALRLHFSRPDEIMRAVVFRHMLEDTGADDADISKLVAASKHETPYSISDLTDRIGRLALRRAWKENRPFGFAFVAEAIAEVEPTPLLERRHWL